MNRIIFIALLVIGTGCMSKTSFPKAESISNVALEGRINAYDVGDLTIEGFRKLLRSAEPCLKPEAWHYAPWYFGSFESKGQTYRFKLFLGGLGVVEDSDGRQQYFKFQPDHIFNRTR